MCEYVGNPFCFMAKSKNTIFFCKVCGSESAKWLGQCPACREWNTMEEVEVSSVSGGGSSRKSLSGAPNMAKPMKLSEVSTGEEARYSSGMSEFDRVLGGGIVQGSLVLVGGDPGIGKSTLLLQLCKNLSESGKHVLYVSGEESATQIKMRAQRLDVRGDDLYLLCETNLNQIENEIVRMKPDLVVIDSIQTMFREEVPSTPGSVAQVRESTAVLMRIAKGMGITVLIVGHVTKEGVVAGPRLLEHMVDTVLYFEGERNMIYRLLRSVKNRFGSTNEIGLFSMHETGLEQVENPSAFMLEDRPKGVTGDVITCSMEGTRAILLEIQALISNNNSDAPARRTAVGVDYNRVSLLMAVMEKIVGLRVSGCDAFVNVTAGLKIVEPALDLAIAVAVASSFLNVSVPDDMIIFGEVGLAGEIRAVSCVEQRVAEAAKLGFRRCILPKVCADSMSSKNPGIHCIGVSNVSDVIRMLQGR